MNRGHPRFSSPLGLFPESAVLGFITLLTLVVGSAKLATAQTYTFSVIHNFAEYPTDAGWPLGALLLDTRGHLYGIGYIGGVNATNSGAIFEADSAGHEKMLYSFTGTPDGAEPSGSLINDSAGNLYGITLSGGTSNAGTIFQFNLKTHQETVLYSFQGGEDGLPAGELARDTAGNLYGITSDGGDLTCGNNFGCGTIFKLDSSGAKTILHTFEGTDGSIPLGGLLRDGNGNLYGTANTGGASGEGVVFKLNAKGKFLVLYSFTGTTDGGYPKSALIGDGVGNLYGVASVAGLYGWGTIFKINGQTGQETTLYSFTGGTDGALPTFGLVRDSAGNLYGTTYSGGDFTCTAFGDEGCGTIFKLDTTGALSVLRAFTPTDGLDVEGRLTLDGAGNLFGTAFYGGPNGFPGFGTLFMLSPQ